MKADASTERSARSPNGGSIVMTRLLCASMLVIFFGCASSGLPHSPSLTPHEFRSGTEPITFTRLVIRIPAGTEIGRHHSGLLKVKRDRYRWGSGIFVASDEFKILASETMRDQGITVLGGDNLLFGRDESGKATYQLGGTLIDLRHNTYDGLAGDYVESWVKIEWQVYHALRENIIFSHTSTGVARHSDWRTGAAALKEAFQGSLKNLLADDGFAALLEASTQSAEDWKIAQLAELQTCTFPAASSLPRDAEQAFAAVPVVRVGAALGSSVIVSPEGYLLTAAHVVSEVEEATVRFHSGLELTARVLGMDRGQDVALLKLPGSGYSCLPLHRGGITVGSDVFAIGNPYREEYAFTLTRGVVSGHRQHRGFPYVQTDASLNPGNSGGPMLNADAEIVGIVSFRLTGVGVEGIAFGVPPAAIVDRLGLKFRD